MGPLSTYNIAMLSLKLRNKSKLNQDLRKLKILKRSLSYHLDEFDGLSNSHGSIDSSDSSSPSISGTEGS